LQPARHAGLDAIKLMADPRQHSPPPADADATSTLTKEEKELQA
jgi:hypothetical protein